MLGPKHFRNSLLNYIVTLDGITVCGLQHHCKKSDQELSLDSHKKQISKYTFSTFLILKKCDTLSQNDAKTVQAFVSSMCDYCYTPLSGCSIKSLKTLQLIQDAAASSPGSRQSLYLKT